MTAFALCTPEELGDPKALTQAFADTFERMAMNDKERHRIYEGRRQVEVIAPPELLEILRPLLEGLESEHHYPPHFVQRDCSEIDSVGIGVGKQWCWVVVPPFELDAAAAELWFELRCGNSPRRLMDAWALASAAMPSAPVRPVGLEPISPALYQSVVNASGRNRSTINR